MDALGHANMPPMLALDQKVSGQFLSPLSAKNIAFSSISL
jgi:hypothetical protein